MQENPFQLEKDPQKFIQKLEQERNMIQEIDQEDRKLTHFEKLYNSKENPRFGFLSKIEEQTNKLAQERDQMFAEEAKSKNPNKQIDPIAMHIKHFNPKLLQQKDQEIKKQQYRIRNILKEKRETIIEFIEKKREIYLANLNINTKKEETHRLEDFIKNEQESLRARRLYFKNDCELVKKFMNDVKAQAETAGQQADLQTKKKDEIKAELAKILSQNDRLRQQKQKLTEEVDKLDGYKMFIENLMENHKSRFSDYDSFLKRFNTRQQAVNEQTFLTNVDQQNQIQLGIDPKRQFIAQAIIGILDTMEEDNLRHIQNERDNEDEIEQVVRELHVARNMMLANQKEQEDRLNVLQKQYDQGLQGYHQLERLEKIDQTRLQFSEGQDLEMERIGRKINEIWKETTKNDGNEFSKKIIFDFKQVKQNMSDIEKLVNDLLKIKYKIFLNKKDFLDAFEKRQRALKNKQRQRYPKDEEKRNQTLERRRKKDEYLAGFSKGRPDRKRIYQQKVQEAPEETQEEDLNDDEKYLAEDYELGQVIRPKTSKKQKNTVEQIDVKTD